MRADHPITKNTHIAYKFAILIIATLLNACSSLPDIPVTEESYRLWATRQQALEKIDSWEIHARTAIFVKEEVNQVGFNWVRERDEFAIMIQAPFGQGVFRVESNPAVDQSTAVKLTMPDGKVYLSHSTETLLSQLFGWTIPVAGLKSWIKGSPRESGSYSYELYADGRVKSLRQEGWKINYLDYFANASIERGLPRKMYLKHQDLALKIVIDRWQPLESSDSTPVIFPNFD